MTFPGPTTPGAGGVVGDAQASTRTKPGDVPGEIANRTPDLPVGFGDKDETIELDGSRDYFITSDAKWVSRNVEIDGNGANVYIEDDDTLIRTLSNGVGNIRDMVIRVPPSNTSIPAVFDLGLGENDNFLSFGSSLSVGRKRLFDEVAVVPTGEPADANITSCTGVQIAAPQQTRQYFSEFGPVSVHGMQEGFEIVAGGENPADTDASGGANANGNHYNLHIGYCSDVDLRLRTTTGAVGVNGNRFIAQKQPRRDIDGGTQRALVCEDETDGQFQIRNNRFVLTGWDSTKFVLPMFLFDGSGVETNRVIGTFSNGPDQVEQINDAGNNGFVPEGFFTTKGDYSNSRQVMLGVDGGNFGFDFANNGLDLSDTPTGTSIRTASFFRQLQFTTKFSGGDQVTDALRERMPGTIAPPADTDGDGSPQFIPMDTSGGAGAFTIVSGDEVPGTVLKFNDTVGSCGTNPATIEAPNSNINGGPDITVNTDYGYASLEYTRDGWRLFGANL